MAFFGHLNSKVMELQRQLAQDHGQFATLNLEVDKTLDKLKIFETKVNGEVMEGKALSQVAAGKATDVEADMAELKSRLEGVISDLNGHIGGSFSAVEEEFQKLQQHLQAVGMVAAAGHASRARGSNETNGSVEQSVQNLAAIVTGFGSDNQLMKLTVDGLRLAVNGLISELGPDGCHCKHVDDLKKELDATSVKLNALNIPGQEMRLAALEQAVRALAPSTKTSMDPLQGHSEGQPFLRQGRWTGHGGQA